VFLFLVLFSKKNESEGFHLSIDAFFEHSEKKGSGITMSGAIPTG